MNTHNRSHPVLPQIFGDFRHLHAGETIIVCGCGRSLAGFSYAKDFVTIGVNDVGRLFHPDYLVVVNSRHQFAAERFEFVQTSQAKAIFSQLDLGLDHPNQVRFRLGQRGGTEVRSGDQVPYTRNSPYVAVNLAIHMGARKIGLIGVDFTEHHFYGDTGNHSLAREIRQIDQEYSELARACKKNGVELVNLSAQSQISAISHRPIEDFAPEVIQSNALNIVSYATTPIAGVPAILSRAISERSPHKSRSVWQSHGYGNGVEFEGDIAYGQDADAAREALETADVVIVHNGKVDPQHRDLINSKPVVTLAHNYKWNVDCSFVERGYPALVVGQYQAVLAEFEGWSAVPNPLPYWEEAFKPVPKGDVVTVAFTPSGKHELYPRDHRLYWHSKGYDTTMGVLNRLVASHGIKLEAIQNKQVSHSEALAMKARAHIVIDECATGSYHRNSLEGLAAGAVVVNGLGQLAGVEDVLLACANGAQSHPFAKSTLGRLDATLTELVELGPRELAKRGEASRNWIVENWDFARQWPTFFEPAIQRAMENHAALGVSAARVPAQVGSVRVEPQTANAKQEAASLSDISVVIPFGGKDRLRNVAAVLQRVKDAGVGEIVLAESDQSPLAAELAEKSGARHVFVRNEGGFHKARVMNVGATLATMSNFVWLDADLIVDQNFLTRALAEMGSRRLDCLVPWSSVHYLDEADSDAVARGDKAPQDCTYMNTYFTRQGGRGGVVVMRRDFFEQHGGVPEEFHGWGGEDNAFYHKASVLGRAAATLHSDQATYHLFHNLSGGHGPNEAILSNPRYNENLALLHDIRRIGSAQRMSAAFPPPGFAPAPWNDPISLYCEDDAVDLGKALRDRFGDSVSILSDQAHASHVLSGGLARNGVSGRAVADAVANLSRQGNCVCEPSETPRDVSENTGCKLNLGCFDRPRQGYVNVDFHEAEGIDVVDGLEGNWPWPDNSVDHVEAHDVIEHLPDPVNTMNELWRVLVPGCIASISVPTTDGPGAFQDPTHVSFWNRNSFHYYECGNSYRKRFAARYGINACFRIVRERIETTSDGPVLHINLEKVVE